MSVPSAGRPSTVGQDSLGTRGFIVGRNPKNASSVGKPFVGAQTSFTTPSSTWERSPMNAVTAGRPSAAAHPSLTIEGCTVRETLPVKQMRRGPSQTSGQTSVNIQELLVGNGSFNVTTEEDLFQTEASY